MTLEVRPLGVACNISCAYCYQTPIREAGNTPVHYSMELIMRTLEQEQDAFSLFGGEALLVPKADLRTLFSYGLEKHKRNAVQTNGSLIDAEFIDMFKAYNVHVGFSMDGPGELNDARWVKDLDRTREMTARSEHNLRWCLAEGLQVGLIVTLHELNAGDDQKLERLFLWLKDLSAAGLRNMRIHILEVDTDVAARTLALSPERNLTVYRQFRQLAASVPGLYVDVFRDLEKLMSGDDSRVTCVYQGCDPLSTAAVRGVDGDGKLSNCGRTAKEGVDWAKTSAAYTRSIQLYLTPQEHQGCKGCRFFLLCRGNCPGTAFEGDFRNRSANCELWFALMEDMEQEFIKRGEVPFSLSPDRLEVEHHFMQHWIAGKNPTIKAIREHMPRKMYQVEVKE